MRRAPAAARLTRRVANDACAAIEAVLCRDTAAAPVALHEPDLGGNAHKYLQQCVAAGEVAAAGTFINRFERTLTQITGTRHAVATSSGTAALHVALLLAGVQPGDEVLVPSLAFVACANAVRYCEAVPHFVDVDAATLGLDTEALSRHLAALASCRRGVCVNARTGRRIGGILAVHTLGHPVDLDRLLAVAAHYHLAIIEDAAEALGSLHRRRPVGGFGRVGVLSFNGNKIVTTGGGGAVLTDDDELAATARHLIATAKEPHPWAYTHDRTGYNYRMPNLNAALGCAQLERLAEFVAAKRRLARRYQQALGSLRGVRCVREPAAARSNYWLNAVVMPSSAERTTLLALTHGAGVLTRAAWTPLHTLPMFRRCPAADLAATDAVAARLVCLPSSARLAAPSAPRRLNARASARHP